MAGAPARPSSSRGAEPPRAAPGYRGVAASAAPLRRMPSSTFSPRHSTTTRSAISATTPMSWVMKTTDMPSSSCSCLISSRICACTVTSSAVVGSSAIEQLRFAGERHRDHDALPHAAREPMRIFVEALARRRHLHALENAQSFALRRVAAESTMVDQRLRDLESDREHGVQARHRLLKDHGQGRRREPRASACRKARVCHVRRGERRLRLRLFAGGNRPITASAATVLPEPDSPTTASVSRGPTSKESFATAGRQTPSPRKWTERSRIDRIGWPPAHVIVPQLRIDRVAQSRRRGD